MWPVGRHWAGCGRRGPISTADGPDPGRLLDRDAELTAVRAAVDAVAAGHPRTVVVVGPAGSGRTTLLEVTAGLAAARGLPVRRLGGPGPLPGGPLVVLVDDLDDAAAEVGLRAAGLARGSAGPAPVLLVAALRGTGSGRSTPGAVTADDVAACLGPAPPAARPAIDALLTAAGARLLPLLPLRSASTRTVLDAADWPVDAVEAARAATAGLPGWLAALGTELAADGADRTGSAVQPALVRAAAERVTADRLPAVLRRLGPEATALVRAVAVLGTGAGRGTVAALAELDDIAREAASARSAAFGVLEADGVRFLLPRAAAVVLATTDPATLRSTRERAARILDAGGAAPETVADQLLGAGPPSDSAAVAVLRTSGTALLAGGQPGRAALHLGHALTGPVPVSDRAALLTDLAVAERSADPRRALSHLDAALALLADPVERARTTLRLVPLLAGAGTGALLRRIDAARDGLPAADPPSDLRMRLAALEAHVAAGDLRHIGRIHSWSAGTERARTASGPGGRAVRGAHALCSAWALHATAATTERRLAAALGETDESFLRPLRVAALGMVERTGGDASRHAEDERVLRSARRRDRPVVRALLRAERALERLRSGHVLDALADGLQALEDRGDDMDHVVGPVRYVVGIALIEAGRPQEAVRRLRPGPDEPDRWSWRHSWVLTARAAAAEASGRPEEALRLLDDVERRMRAAGALNPAPLDWRERLSLLALGAGDTTRAAELSREQLGLARRWRASGALGSALRTSGLVTPGRAGTTLLRRAHDELAGSPRTLEWIRCGLDLAERLGPGDPDATRLATEALALAEARGARLQADRAHALLPAGEEHRVGTGRRNGGLTAAEREIARLAASGMSNPEIADALHLTRRTVELHLTRAYRKLGICGRHELGEALGGAVTPARPPRAP